MNFDQLNAARDKALDAGTKLGERTLDTTKANTSALFDLYNKGLQVRTAEDVKAFWGDVAVVARQNTERVVALFQDNSQNAMDYAQSATKSAEEVVKAASRKR